MSPETYMWSLKNKYVWFVFVSAAIAVLVWGPYWAWNLFHHQSSWWRISIISGTVFDTPAYLQWLGQTANGWEIGGHIRWFVWPLRALTWAFPHDTISEWWLLSRWISITAALWISAWAIHVWSGFDTWRSRWIALAFWLSFVPAIGMRPGVFSWYLPFGIISLTVPLIVIRRLQGRRFLAAIGWTVVAVAASSVYTWFMIVAIIWLATMWSAGLVSRSIKLFLAAVIITLTAIALLTPAVAAWLVMSTSGSLLFDLQLKSGLGFTHLPQITNSFLAMLVWIGILLAASRGLAASAGTQRKERLVELQWAWLATLFAWLITPFTGVYLHNDHFRAPVLILSWMSVAALWSVTERTKIDLSRSSRWVLLALASVAAVFILKIICTPYGFSTDDLNVLHLSHWFTIIIVICLLLSNGSIEHSPKWRWGVMAGAIFIGGVGALSIYQREFTELPNRIVKVPQIEWIQKNIPVNDAICSDPQQADFLATFTGRRIFPAGTTLYYRERSTDTLRRVGVYSSGYDVIGSGNIDYVTYMNQFGRSMICQQFLQQAKFLKFFGVSSEHIDAITGCPRDFLRSIDQYTLNTTHQPAVNAPAFQVICPWVVISSDQKPFWRLPNGYTETPISPTMSVWHALPRS